MDDEAARAQAQDALVDLDDVEFIVAAPGHARPWPRDWGPPARFGDETGYDLIDPTFDDYPFSNAACDSRLYYQKHWFLSDFTDDDAATRIVADTLGFSSTHIPVALTGGNALVDGHGTIFSTCTLMNENRRLGVTEDRFFDEVGRNLGVSRYVVIANFETFGASIPGGSTGGVIEYFLSAADQSGRKEALPRTAPDGFYSFTVASEFVQ